MEGAEVARGAGLDVGGTWDGADGDAEGMPEEPPLGSPDGVEPAEPQAASPNRAAEAIRLRNAEGNVIR